jgi:folate-binding protein YgfZ
MTLRDDFDRLREGGAFVDRSDRGFVTVSGPDTFSFLQAIVSADLDPISDGDGVHSLLLSPQGKLDVDFRLLRVADDVAWLDCDPGLGTELVTSLRRFRIRVKAEIEERSGVFAMLSFVGSSEDAPRALHSHRVRAGMRFVRTRWGVDAIGPRADVLRHTAELVDGRWAPVSPLAYEAWRIEQGIPVQPFDVDDSTIPQEAFLEQDAVSFTKGCFIGQELVCRIDSRGHVNRFLRRVHDIEGDWPPVGAEIVVEGKVVGSVTSVAPVELPTGALGYVRREVEPPASVELRWDGGAARATADALG